MRRLSMGLLVVAILGCERTLEPLTLPPTDAAIVGSFNLLQVNGRALPIIAAVTTNDAQYDLVGDRMIVSDQGTWAETTSYNVTSFSTSDVTPLATQTAGTYTVGSGAITFTRVAGGPLTFTGSVTGNTLSLLLNGVLSVYSR